jgi:hypothetical protein
LAEWLRQIEIIDSMLLVLRRVRARGGDTPRRRTQRLGQAFARAARSAGVGVLQFPCQRFKLGFGDDRRRGMVGGPHLLRHRRGEVIGQLVGDVSQLVNFMPTSA